MTSLQFTQGRISKKSRSFWSCFEAQLHHSFWSLSHTWIVWDIRYSDHFGKNFSTILKILNMQQLRNFLGRTSPLKASHIYLYLQIIQIQSLLLGHYPPTPPQLNTPPSPTLNQAYHHSPTNHPTEHHEHLFRVSKPCWESTPIPRQYNLHALPGRFSGSFWVSRSVGGEHSLELLTWD